MKIICPHCKKEMELIDSSDIQLKFVQFMFEDIDADRFIKWLEENIVKEKK